MGKDIYIRRAEEAIARAEKLAETYQGPCSTCKYSRSTFYKPICVHPIVEVAARSVDQGNRQWYVECDEQRLKGSTWGPTMCGPDGILYEEKDSLLYRLFKR